MRSPRPTSHSIVQSLDGPAGFKTANTDGYNSVQSLDGPASGGSNRARRPRRSSAGVPLDRLARTDVRQLGLLCQVGGGRRVRVALRWSVADAKGPHGLAQQVVARTATTLTPAQVRRLQRAVARRLQFEGWSVVGEIRHEGRAATSVVQTLDTPSRERQP